MIVHTKQLFLSLSFTLLIGLSACTNGVKDRAGPQISNVQTSGNVLVISDCLSTSVTISANVTDPSGVEAVLLWYRTGNEQQFSSIDMEPKEGAYQVRLNGPDFLGRPYGTLEFYITAMDKKGNLSRSAVNQSIQFLPCVNH